MYCCFHVEEVYVYDGYFFIIAGMFRPEMLRPMGLPEDVR